MLGKSAAERDPRNDLAELRARHEAFWRLEEVDIPLLKIPAHANEDHPYVLALNVAEAVTAKENAFLTPDLIQPERIYGRFHGQDNEFSECETIGDVFAVIMPYDKLPWVEAIVGCPVQVSLSANTMWSRPCLSPDWFARNEDIHLRQEWIETLVDFTKYLVRVFGNRFAVTQTGMRGPSDLLSAVLGYEGAVKAMYRNPQEVRLLLERLSAVFLDVAKAQLNVIPKYCGGHVDCSGVWAPGTTVRTQDDASRLMSPKMYEDFFLPFEERICSNFEYSSIHLHSASLQIVDQVLRAKHIRGVEVAYDFPPYGPPLNEVIPILAKIQKVKPLFLEGAFTQDEVRRILRNLEPKGLLLSTLSLADRI